jgi:hypothetical protein
MYKYDVCLSLIFLFPVTIGKSAASNDKVTSIDYFAFGLRE